MPAYCYDWSVGQTSTLSIFSHSRLFSFLDTVHLLSAGLQMSPPKLPSYIRVSPSSIPGILESLRYWTEKISSKTVGVMLSHHPIYNNASFNSQMKSDPSVSQSYLATLRSQEEEDRQKVARGINALPEEEVIKSMRGIPHEPWPGRGDPISREKWLKSARRLIIDRDAKIYTALHGYGLRNSEEVLPEVEWYTKTKIFIPPSILRQKYHAEINQVWLPMRDGGHQAGWQDEEKKRTVLLYSLSSSNIFANKKFLCLRSKNTFREAGDLTPVFLYVVVFPPSLLNDKPGESLSRTPLKNTTIRTAATQI